MNKALKAMKEQTLRVSEGGEVQAKRKSQGCGKLCVVLSLNLQIPCTCCMCVFLSMSVCAFEDFSKTPSLVRGFNFCLNDFLHFGSSLIDAF